MFSRSAWPEQLRLSAQPLLPEQFLNAFVFQIDRDDVQLRSHISYLQAFLGGICAGPGIIFATFFQRARDCPDSAGRDWMRTARAILEITRVATVRFQMGQDCEKERHSQRRFADSTHDFQRELIRLFFIGACDFHPDGIVRRMTVVKMPELVCHDEHDASSKSSLKYIV